MVPVMTRRVMRREYAMAVLKCESRVLVRRGTVSPGQGDLVRTLHAGCRLSSRIEGR